MVLQRSLAINPASLMIMLTFAPVLRWGRIMTSATLITSAEGCEGRP